jgi:transposase
VSKAVFDACLIMPDGNHQSLQAPNNPAGFAKLDTWLASHRATQCYAGLEATGPYGVALLWHLHTNGHHACQLNPRRVKDFARSQGRRVKTDQTDARLIAEFLKALRPQPWAPPAVAIQTLQALVRRRAQLLDALQAERSRKEGTTPALVAASLERHIKQIKAEVTMLDKAIDKHVLENMELQKSVRLLRSIDGIGRMVAVTILAEVPAISSFERARDLAAFAGLTPSVCQSGSSVRKRGGMTKEGSALLRKMLYMAALQSAKSTTNAFHPLYQSFVARGKAKMCALGAIMHKLIRIAFGVLKHQTKFAPNLARMG